MSNIKVEVKGRFGRFLPYGNIDAHKSALENALDYIQHDGHGDFYAVPAIIRGGKNRAGAVKVALFTRDAVLNAVQRYGVTPAAAPALAMHNGGVAVLRMEYTAIRRTFGTPAAEYSTALTKWDDVRPDAGCPNAPYARAWEKICAAAAGGKWCGGLRNVQIDFTINENDD